MKTCRNCYTKFEDSVKICYACGEDVSLSINEVVLGISTCTNCNIKQEVNLITCYNCGKKLPKATVLTKRNDTNQNDLIPMESFATGNNLQQNNETKHFNMEIPQNDTNLIVADLKENKESNKPSRNSINLLLALSATAIVAILAFLMIHFTQNNQVTYESLERNFISSFTNFNTNDNTFFLTAQYNHDLDTLGNLFGFSIPHILLDLTVVSDGILSNIYSTILLDNVPLDLIATISLADGTMFGLPTVSDYFFFTPPEEDFETNITLNIDEMINTLNEIIDVYFYLVNDVLITETDVPLIDGSISLETTQFTVNFTKSLILDLANSIVDILLDNQNLMEFSELSFANELTNYGSIEQFFAFYLHQLENNMESYLLNNHLDTNEDHSFFTMTVWENNGRLVGRTIEGSELSFIHRHMESGDQLYLELSMNSGEYGIVNFSGNFTRDGGAWYGNPTLLILDDFNQVSIVFNVYGFRSQNGITHGSVNYSDTIEGIPVSFNLFFSEINGNQGVTITGGVNFGFFAIDLGELIISYSSGYTANIEIPQWDLNYAIIIDDFSTENMERMSAFLSDIINFSELIDNTLGDFIISAINDMLFTIF